MEYLGALSPIDGRYREQTAMLRPYFSEKAFFSYRTLVEINYLISFVETTNIAQLSKVEKEDLLKNVVLSDQDCSVIKKIEAKTHHDIKALEYFLRERIKNKALHPYIHFALTSEDVNNIAYSLMIIDALENVILPTLSKITNQIAKLGNRYQNTPILARTHGQPASPTTFGKEMRVFHYRLVKKIQKIKNHDLEAKLNGATGNFSAHVVAFPHIDWVKFSTDFINSFNENRTLKLKPNIISTQIEPRDSLAELFTYFEGLNTILIDLCQDMWRYISDSWLVQEVVEGEVGSSTMPHKVNPISFENGEGNLGLANALFSFFSDKLPISRLQRDLSDSTVMRNIGVSFSHSLLAYQSIYKGLSGIRVNEETCLQALDNNPQVVMEALQVILKREGVHNAYEKLLVFSRGKDITREQIKTFINTLDISEKVKEELLSINPRTYLGLASNLNGSP